MDISIVIPTCEGVSTLKRCLRMLGRQRIDNNLFSHEVLIVMDKKDRMTEEWFSTERLRYPQVQIVRAKGTGVINTRNKGIEESRGEVVFFLDDDCVPPHKLWLKEVFLTFRSHQDAAVIGGGYRCRERNNIFVMSRNKLDTHYLKCNKAPSGETAVLLGGDCGYRRRVFDQYGIFDETLQDGSAETEMYNRIKQNGGRMFYCEELSIFHITPPKSIIAYSNKSFKQGRGQAYSSVKNDTPSMLAGYARQHFWFLAIAKEYAGKITGKLIIGVFILGNAAFYFLGKMYGTVRYTLKK